MSSTVEKKIKTSWKKKILRLSSFFFLGAVLGVILLIFLFVLATFRMRQVYTLRVYPGVTLDGFPVSGKNSEELVRFLVDKEAKLQNQQVTFVDLSEQKWEITPQMLDFGLDKEKTLQEAFALGRSKTGFGGFIEPYQLMFFPQEISLKYTYSQEKLEQIINELATDVEIPAQDALLEFRDGKVVEFQTSREGRRLDKEQVKSLLVSAFSRENKELLVLPLPVEQVKPKVTDEASNNLGIVEKIGEGESFFYDSIPSRVHNIGLAASRIHGLVLAPGETFSFSEKVGSISAQTGYQQAYVIREKKTILEDGGGVCQVSTTIFRAALNAGLPIVERHPHYYRVGFYEQGGFMPGMDATVYPPSPDFKFKNDTTAHLLIQVNFDKANKHLTFTLYGTSDGRRAEVDKPIIHSRIPVPEPIYIDDPNLPIGTVKQTEQPHPGAKVSFKRRVFSAGGELIEEKEFWSNYVAWPAVYLKGIKPL